MEKLIKTLKEITILSKENYHDLVRLYPKILVDKYLDNQIERELVLSKNINDKIIVWNKYGYYLSTKDHSIYEKFELSSLETEEKIIKGYLTKKEELIYGLHLLCKEHLVIIKEHDQTINLDIEKVFSSIKTKETRDYILNKLKLFLNNTKINSNNNKYILEFLKKYTLLCKIEEIPNLSNLFGNKPKTIDEEELIEQIDMYIRYSHAKEMFLCKNIALVEYVASNCYEEDQHYQDTIQDGIISLNKAIDTFDIRNKNKFSTYAVPVITRDIVRKRMKYDYGTSLTYYFHDVKRKLANSLRNLTNKLKRYPTMREIADYLNISEERLEYYIYFFYIFECRSLDEPILTEELALFTIKDTIIDENINIEEEFLFNETKKEIFKILEEILTVEELDILFKRNGINTKEEKIMTLKEIGEIKNVSIEGIRKKETKAFEKIKRNSRIKKLNPFIK